MFKSPEKLPVESIAYCGGKARGLLRLSALAYEVPRFLVLDPLALEEWVSPAGQDPHVIAEFLRSETVLHQLTNMVGELPHEWLHMMAVRSSAADEDGNQNSFAGIHESILGVSGTQAIATAVRDVLLSAYSERALLYRLQRGLSLKKIRITVILQKLVSPLFAGVAFGAHPVTGDRDTVWISMTEGLGDALVSGTVQGEELSYSDGVLRFEGELAGRVPPAFLNKVVQTVRTLSISEGRPQDVEWAWDGLKLWILQTRPITAKANAVPATVVFDNSNIQESYCGVTTPLTFSYASTAYAKVYDQNLKFIGVSGRRLQESSLRHENLLGLIRGRVYYNINQWYASLSEMPGFGKRKAEMEDMMGLEHPVDFVEDTRASPIEKLQRLPGIALILSRLMWKFSRLDSLVREFDVWFWQVYRSVDVSRLDQMSDQKLLLETRRLQDEFLEKWGIPILNDLKVMLAMGQVKRALKKCGLENELKSAMYGSELESVKPTTELHRLAGLAASDPKVAQALRLFKGDGLSVVLKSVSAPFAMEVERYIDLYGDRCMGELKLETTTMRQDSEIFYSLLRSYIESGLHLKSHLFASHTADPIGEKLASLPKIKRYFLEKKIAGLKKSVAHRELLRFHRSRNFGLMRSLYRAIGKRWADAGFLDQESDIFYLTIQEVEAFGNGRSVTRSLRTLVSLRRAEFAEYKTQQMGAQVTVGFPAAGGEPRSRVTPKHEDGADLRGLACSAGVVEGEIRFVDCAENARDLGGKILLAERTDPGWTPLFALVKGVVIERGSMLSHSAVIAREMGIPAVVAVPNVTQILKDGDYVRLDGNLGRIEILDRPQVQPARHSEAEAEPV